jgi:hypothetical protein
VDSSACFAKARELGEMLLATEESLRFSDTLALIENPSPSFSKDEAVAAFIAARKDFSRLAAQVADLVLMTALGESAAQGGCASCGGCARKA